ncbi:MAG: methyl-accepting chemotaxis protein [Burkholderiales bacterium]
MALKQMKLGTRLGSGFAAVLALMALMIGLALARFSSVGESSDKIITKDWVKAEAAADIDATTRANARRTLELLLVTDKGEVDKIHQFIDANKKKISESLAILERLVHTPEGQALLAKIKDARASYVASFGKVDKLVGDGKRDEASKLMFAETLPALDLLQGRITEIVALEKKLVEASGAGIKQDIESARMLMLAIGLAGLLVGGGVAWWLTRTITGQLGGEPDYAANVVREIAAGNLAVEVQLRAGDGSSLLAAMKAMRDSLARVVGQVRNSSDSIATGSAQIATGNADLSQRTEEQASNLQQTAASMEQLSGTVKISAETAGEANQLAASASDAAVRGGEMVGTVVNTMQDIATSSKKIADIIGVIDGIAFQTNILALNAAVEAARAGEQGRGFAVVASEVRNLAGRSAEAAKEIKSLISASVEKVEVGARQVNDAGASMTEIVSQVQRVSQLISEISNASNEQATGISQVGDAVTQLDQVTQQNAALVEESAAAAESLRHQAATLAEVVRVFKLSGGVHTGSSTHAAPVAAKSAAVARPQVRAKPAVPASAASEAPRAPNVAMAKTGTDDNWETF